MQRFRPFSSKRCSLSPRPPLPVFKDLNSFELLENTTRYGGKFDGFTVIVENPEAMVDLYTKGYFGQGSLSSGYPSFCKKKKTSETEKTGDETTPESHVQQSGSSTAIGEEKLNLMLEEAFFLSYALNILDVYQNDEILSTESLWVKFQSIIPNFIPRYVAYHYFRSKGWVVKPGIKFGGDFTLYKDGPPFYHASFVVQLVYNLNDSERQQGFSPFLAHYRALEVVKKDMLICQIVAPQNLEESTPDNLNKFKISEYLFKRWIPSENRE